MLICILADQDLSQVRTIPFGIVTGPEKSPAGYICYLRVSTSDLRGASWNIQCCILSFLQLFST